jgi:uncharacterized protein (DUF433 family)
MDWRERIVIDPAIHQGDPCIKGTRVPVSVIVGSIADGDTHEQLFDAYPQLTADDIKAALSPKAKINFRRRGGRRDVDRGFE